MSANISRIARSIQSKDRRTHRDFPGSVFTHYTVGANIVGSNTSRQPREYRLRIEKARSSAHPQSSTMDDAERNAEEKFMRLHEMVTRLGEHVIAESGSAVDVRKMAGEWYWAALKGMARNCSGDGVRWDIEGVYGLPTDDPPETTIDMTETMINLTSNHNDIEEACRKAGIQYGDTASSAPCLFQRLMSILSGSKSE